MQNTTTTKIEEATQTLAAALQEDERWAEWRDATEVAGQNAELNAVLDRYHYLSKKSHDAKHNGPALTEGEQREMPAIQKWIEENTLFVRHQAASQSVMQMMREANESLSAVLGIEFSAMAAPLKKASCR